ncbi:MAG: hypothetical protein J0J03_11935 [Leifsonia sp.]|nr:hypothetical protein [Leifsonia sp.]
MALLSLGLAGCASDAVSIDYRGPHTGEVAACAEMASAGTYRQDDGVPSRVWIDQVKIVQSSGSDTDNLNFKVEGVTHATDASGEQRYHWQCELTKDLLERRLTATLTVFDKE